MAGLVDHAAFPLPAHRTGRADLPHPALRLASRQGPRRCRTVRDCQPESGHHSLRPRLRVTAPLTTNRHLSRWNLPPLVFRAFGAHRNTPVVGYCALVSNRQAFPSRFTCPAVGPAKCVPITRMGVSASSANMRRRVASAAAGSKSALEHHSGWANWQGWCAKSPVIRASSPREEIFTDTCPGECPCVGTREISGDNC